MDGSGILASTRNEPPVRNDPGPSRILLVDDDELVAETYEAILASSGYQVTSVSSGAAALAALGEDAFDLLVTDLSMPEMSGLELVRLVRDRRPELPVVLLSGWVAREERERIAEAGVDHVVVKPCEVHELLETVRAAFEARED